MSSDRTRKKNDEDRRRSGGTKQSSLTFGLPSLSDARQVTTDSDSRVARSVGAVASGPGLTGTSGFPGFGPPSMAPSHGAKMAPPTPMLSSGLPAKSPAQSKSIGSEFSVTSVVQHTTPYGWKFDDVPTLPEFHPLERTAVFVPRAEAPEVASRVSDLLRKRSVAATYDDSKAKAKCATEDGVEFRVRLYRGRNKFSHGVIVEVQRRFGFSVGFHELSLAILDAAEGKAQSSPLVLPPKNLIPIVSDAESDDECEPLPSPGGKRKASPNSSYSVASDMLKRSRTVDANVLALESLASLTDPAKMGKTTALRASRHILSADGNDDVRQLILSLLVDGRLDVSGTILGSNDADVVGLRLLAMTVLCNAVCAVPQQILKEQSACFMDEVLPVLIKELWNAESNSRMAVQSARCLETLMASQGIATDMINGAKEVGVYGALQVAHQVGLRGSDHLTEVASRCLKVLETK